MLNQTFFQPQDKRNLFSKNKPGSVNNSLPSFHIEVIEQLGENGKVYLHRTNSNTSRICMLINSATNPSAEVLLEKVAEEPIPTLNLRSYYSKIAAELSSLNPQELLDNFSDLRICFSANRSQKNYNFKF